MTRNEEDLIFDCIAHHMPYVDEVIVLDHESTDKTATLAELAGAKVIVKKIEFPDDRRNFMQSIAKYEWCLHVDADELLELAFMQKMKEMLQINKKRSVVFLPRVNLPDAEGWPDRQARLVKKSRVVWYRHIHEIIRAVDGDKPFDDDCPEELIIVSSPTIIHRIVDRSPAQRITRLEEWKKILLENTDDFTDIEWEIKHLDAEIRKCEERL